MTKNGGQKSRDTIPLSSIPRSNVLFRQLLLNCLYEVRIHGIICHHAFFKPDLSLF
jgi:hypothetical protein